MNRVFLLNGLERLQDFSGVGVTLSLRIWTNHPIVRAHSLPLEVSNLASEAFIHSGSGNRSNSSARDLLLENYVWTLWTSNLPEEQEVVLCSGLEVVLKEKLTTRACTDLLLLSQVVKWWVYNKKTQVWHHNILQIKFYSTLNNLKSSVHFHCWIGVKKIKMVTLMATKTSARRKTK